MISGTYTTIKLGGEITAEFGISYFNYLRNLRINWKQFLVSLQNSGINWRRYTEKKSLRSKLKML